MEKEPILHSPKFHKIWVKQCAAAEHIKLRYGSKAAFNYIVAEELFNFADAATAYPEFARELPRFVARVRGLFTAEEIRAHLDRIEREYDANINRRDEFDEQDEQLEVGLESTTTAEERARQFAVIVELLTAAELG